MAIARKRITIVSCGPGSPEYLTPLAHDAVKGTKILIGSKRLLEMFPENGEKRISVGVNIEAVLDSIAAEGDESSITVLVSGDAGLHSLAKPVIRRFGRENCSVIPGISSVQVAFARVGHDWVDAKIISAHESDPDTDAASLGVHSKIAVLGGREESLLYIAKLADSIGDERKIYVCENLTLPEESVREVELANLKQLKVSSLTIVLLIKKELMQ